MNILFYHSPPVPDSRSPPPAALSLPGTMNLTPSEKLVHKAKVNFVQSLHFFNEPSLR